MTMTTKILSVSVPVADQDAALRYYTEVLGCELRADNQPWPGARYIEVVPPGSDVGLVLLRADSGIPVAVRLGTTDADVPHQRLTAVGTPPETEVVHLEGAPPMFAFVDPDGNQLVYLEDTAAGD
jgi:catechol 2,3-dioxygenase-like lactoylglutathione lyase family enzyme